MAETFLAISGNAEAIADRFRGLELTQPEADWLKQELQKCVRGRRERDRKDQSDG